MKSYHALLLPTSGPIQLVALPKAGKASYETLTQAVGGFIERFFIEDAMVWVNEEGLLKGLPRNSRLMVLAELHFELAQPLAGDALICGTTRQSNPTDCPKWVYEELAVSHLYPGAK